MVQLVVMGLYWAWIEAFVTIWETYPGERLCSACGSDVWMNSQRLGRERTDASAEQWRGNTHHWCRLGPLQLLCLFAETKRSHLSYLLMRSCALRSESCIIRAIPPDAAQGS